MKIKSRKVIKPVEKIPKGVEIAKDIAYLFITRELSNDVGIAQTTNGKVFFAWGGNRGNLSHKELEPNKEYVYIGSIYDTDRNECRNNYAEVIAKGGLLYE